MSMRKIDQVDKRAQQILTHCNRVTAMLTYTINILRSVVVSSKLFIRYW